MFIDSNSSSSSSSPSFTSPCFIEIDGLKFYSDRFYLNKPTGLISSPLPETDDNNDSGPTLTDDNRDCTTTNCCYCQSSVPPLFDRSKLIQSLRLRAAVVSTYVFDPDWMSKEMPSLFPPPTSDIEGMKNSNCVPTLFLHGHKSMDSISSNHNHKIENNRHRRQPKSTTRRFTNTTSWNKKRKHINSSKGTTTNSDSHTKATTKIIKSQLQGASINNEMIEIMDSSSDDDGPTGTCSTDDEEFSRNLIQSLASKHGKKLFCEPMFSAETKRPANSNEHKDSITPTSFFGNTVHVTFILPQFVIPSHHHQAVSIEKKRALNVSANKEPQDNVIVIDSSSSEEEDNNHSNISHTQCNNNSTIQQPKAKLLTKRCMGVYHPKFMILFEQNGSIVVVVSTGNTTRPRSVDGTWLQRFYPQKNNVLEEGTKDSRSDFGHVLCDFLQKQSDATKCDEMMTPITFIKRYLGFDSLMDFCHHYEFHKANAYLVSTVPGSYPGRFGSFNHVRRVLNSHRGVESITVSPHISNKRTAGRQIFYGPQRVGDILHQCTQNPGAWLPSHALSKHDRFIIQTTSFGSKWNKQRFHELVKQYMGLDDPNKIHDVDVNQLINNVDIIWPTKEFMDQIQNHVPSEYHKFHSNNSKNETDQNKSEAQHFLSSEQFNLIDPECLSRMTKYEEVNPSLLPYSVSPHIKSYARVMSNYENKGKVKDTGEVYSNLAWFMLTSACLSRGAQGHAEKDGRFEGLDEKSYLNFELGVLFCSRLQGNVKTDVLYRGCHPKKSTCTCNSSIRVINLPIPYKLQSTPYQKFADELDFDEDPFLHEITLGSAVQGNMVCITFYLAQYNLEYHQTRFTSSTLVTHNCYISYFSLKGFYPVREKEEGFIFINRRQIVTNMYHK